MRYLFDQVVLWIYCFLTAFFVPIDIPFVIASLVAIIYACANYLARTKRQKTGLAVMLLLLAVLCERILLFTPFILYACGTSHRDLSCRISFGYGILAVSLWGSDIRILCLIGVGSLIAIVMGHQRKQYDLLDVRFRRTRDDSVEKNLLLKEKNQSILKNQDYEIYTATLKERNRIAREIHDNVGHMLSRGILMVGAMKAVHGEGNLKSSLIQLEETLNAAMTSVRESVHDLHDEAVSLKEVLESLVKEYTFCQVLLEYDMGYDVPREIRYGFIAIVKEALHNVMKHSNATQVRIVAREHPGLYQLVVEDNGTVGERENRAENRGWNRNETTEPGVYQKGYTERDRGIGIRNMKDRVDAFGGNLEIRTDRGWRIYITVPKTAEE